VVVTAGCEVVGCCVVVAPGVVVVVAGHHTPAQCPSQLDCCSSHQTLLLDPALQSDHVQNPDPVLGAVVVARPSVVVACAVVESTCVVEYSCVVVTAVGGRCVVVVAVEPGFCTKVVVTAYVVVSEVGISPSYPWHHVPPQPEQCSSDASHHPSLLGLSFAIQKDHVQYDHSGVPSDSMSSFS